MSMTKSQARRRERRMSGAMAVARERSLAARDARLAAARFRVARAVRGDREEVVAQEVAKVLELVRRGKVTRLSPAFAAPTQAAVSAPCRRLRPTPRDVAERTAVAVDYDGLTIHEIMVGRGFYLQEVLSLIREGRESLSRRRRGRPQRV